ncbi:hypothetical protein FAM23169_02652 [Lentilactobacillus parabuchneri]|uniref:Uncharacterized protein n=1 Tax=Lentilactobacillus parabuchneri TaxID=152331 RepID=A0A1X1FAX8_9LACO|nr:hypothetical protein FAM23169_02652 [Lentilactobacillus parabuchneri]
MDNELTVIGSELPVLQTKNVFRIFSRVFAGRLS